MKPRHFISAILLLLLAYPLSIGPFTLWEARSFVNAAPAPPPQWLENAYSPLGALYNYSPTAHRVLDWYMALWLKDLY
jgi:hypothetical protein